MDDAQKKIDDFNDKAFPGWRDREAAHPYIPSPGASRKIMPETAKLPASFTASTLRLIADHFDAPQGKKIIISPSSQMREEWAILLNQIADELEGG